LLIFRQNKRGETKHHNLWAGLLQKMEADNLIESHNNHKPPNITTHTVVQEIVEDLESNQVADFQPSSTRSYVPISSSSSSYAPIPRSARSDVLISNSSSNPRTDKETPTLFQAEESKTTDISPAFKFENVSEPLTISFKGLKLFLKANHQTLLTNVSGVVKHHKVTALMGPSGAGKNI
jgi:ABC-type multidrug transport system fused ATPase/permease subunit